ncbi:MAG TPA: NADH-quinone oxidoreductase subunit A [Solirubrobacterales bacterium]|nr:NADH-quinone oxidoreductase subunit A [Solirubrobacterales bacterium]
MLKSYLPILVFALLGLGVGGAFVMLNHLIGPKRGSRLTSAGRRQTEPYESGIPVEPARGMRFGISFYLIAMLFILFDIEVVFLYPVAIQLDAFGTFALIETIVFIVLLMIAFVYVWRRGALEWR